MREAPDPLLLDFSPANQIHPLLDPPCCRTHELGRNASRPELCRPPPFAGGFRHRKSQCRRISCPLRFAAPRRTFLTNFHGQRRSRGRGTSRPTSPETRRSSRLRHGCLRTPRRPLTPPTPPPLNAAPVQPLNFAGASPEERHHRRRPPPPFSSVHGEHART